MNIVLVISMFDCGGAQRVMSHMANYWAEKGENVTLIKFDREPPFYRLNEKVNLISLDIYREPKNCFESVKNTLQRLKKIRKAVREQRPDAVISFIDTTNVMTVAALAGTGIPVIISERVDPAKHNIGKKWDTLRRLVYPFCSRLVIQTSNIKDYFGKRIQKKCIVIPNPVIVNKAVQKDYSVRTNSLIAMGRLCEQKGFDVLINAFRRAQQVHQDFRLYIFGEGPLRESLETQIKSLGLNDCVFLPGVTEHPTDEMVKCDMFILSSRYEGFPNVLCEAMSVGMPVIATNCPSGPSEIVRDGENGLLIPVEDEEALYRAMIRLIENNEERVRLGQKAKEIGSLYLLESVMGLWEKTIRSVTEQRK